MATVTVFMPTFRRAASGLLSTAIESVLGQTYGDFELLVLDDGSTDGTSTIVSDFAARDSRVTHVRHEENSGLPALRIAQALEIAGGELFAYMFDDDLWYTHALETLVSALESEPELDMVYGNVRFPWPNEHGEVRTSVLGAVPREFDPDLLRKGNYIGNVGVLHRRSVLDRAGYYDTNILIRRLCDWDLWMRIARKGRILHCDAIVGEANGLTTTDSLGLTASLDLKLALEYIALDRDERLRPDRILDNPPDDLSAFGDHPSSEQAGRAARVFADFFAERGDTRRADLWLSRIEEPPRASASGPRADVG